MQLLHEAMQERENPRENVSSDVVYDRLIAEDWQVPDYALQHLWELLTFHDLAGGMLTHHRGEEQHGAYTFQWTAPNIIEEADDLI